MPGLDEPGKVGLKGMVGHSSEGNSVPGVVPLWRTLDVEVGVISMYLGVATKGKDNMRRGRAGLHTNA